MPHRYRAGRHLMPRMVVAADRVISTTCYFRCQPATLLATFRRRPAARRPLSRLLCHPMVPRILPRHRPSSIQLSRSTFPIRMESHRSRLPGSRRTSPCLASLRLTERIRHSSYPGVKLAVRCKMGVGSAAGHRFGFRFSRITGPSDKRIRI